MESLDEDWAANGAHKLRSDQGDPALFGSGNTCCFACRARIGLSRANYSAAAPAWGGEPLLPAACCASRDGAGCGRIMHRRVCTKHTAAVG